MYLVYLIKLHILSTAKASVRTKPAHSTKLSSKSHAPSEVHSFNVVANFHNNKEVKPTSGIVLLQKHTKEMHDKAKKRSGSNSKQNNVVGHRQILEINPKPINGVEKGKGKNAIEEIKQQTHLTEPINLQAVAVPTGLNIQNSMYPQQILYQNSYLNGYVQPQPQQQQQQNIIYPTNVVVPAVARAEKPIAKSKPCVPSSTNLCPTSPLNLFLKPTKNYHLQHAVSKNTTTQEIQTVAKLVGENDKKEALDKIKLPIKLPIKAIQAEAEKSPTHSAHGGKFPFELCFKSFSHNFHSCCFILALILYI